VSRRLHPVYPRAHRVTVEHGRELAAEYPLVRGVRPCGQQGAGTDDASILYRCSRPIDHTGPHVAHVTDGSVVAWWDQEEPTNA